MRLNTNAIRVMESSDHSKNGASPKSQTSRENFLLFGILLFALGLIVSVFTSCDDDNPIDPDEPDTISVTSISLDKTNLTLKKGQTFTLTATVKPDNATNKNVTWSSSDVSKAIVSKNGEITAVTAGETTITATAGGGKTATCKVTVSESGVSEIAVESITLDKTSLDLFSGNIGQSSGWLTATVKPDNATNKTVTWTSSNPSIAEIVETGSPRFPYVYVRGKGTATISAKAGDKTATCTVNVLDIKLDVRGIELIVGEEYTLNATTNPGGQPVTWASSNTSRAIVEGDYGQGKGIAKAAGTLTISATYQGQTVSCNVTIYDVPLSGVTIEGVTWAARNVNAPGTFAEKVSDGGMFYLWNVKTGYPDNRWIYTNASGTEWSSENDPSPSGWRIPTLYEAQTMLSKVINSDYYNKGRLAIVNGQECVVAKFENNQHLVFRSDHFTFYYYQANYWTSTPYGGDKAYCYTREGTNTSVRSNMMRIRCVKK